jgi:sarcosine oxidase subunit gamma
VADADFAPRAPLDGALTAGRHGPAEAAPGVILAERRFLAAASVAARAGQAGALAERLAAALGVSPPAGPGCTAAAALTLLWSGPGQWLALREGLSGPARFGFAGDLAAAVGDAASVTDLTGARAVLRLTGPSARVALGRLVPIDLDEDAFPPGAAAQTLAGHIGVMLWRPPDAPAAWDIACYRSFGESLAEALLEAALPFGCEVLPDT